MEQAVNPIDIILPTRSNPEDLAKLVEQIHATAGCPHRIVHTGVDASASTNRNLGLDRSQSKVVAMVDDDIEFPPDSVGWLSILERTLALPNVVIVSAQLLTLQGGFAYMTGVNDCNIEPRLGGESIVPTKKLLTACCAFRYSGLRFDERYIGSGFEDLDFCNQLAAAHPDGLFVVCHSAHAVHRNEQKNQNGCNWKTNEAYYNRKWGIK